MTDFYGTSPSGASSGAKWEVRLFMYFMSIQCNRNGVYVQTFRDLMESEELLEEDIEDEMPLHKANDVVSV